MLSLFDGIGAAPYLIDSLFGRPLAAYSWELDRACRLVAEERLPWLRQRGDFTKETVKGIAADIDAVDPKRRAHIIPGRPYVV